MNPSDALVRRQVQLNRLDLLYRIKRWYVHGMNNDSRYRDTPQLNVADRQLAVTYRPIDSLVPNQRNARTHPKRQLEQIVASIREFGFTNPILIDPDGAIIAGHGRLLAAKAMALADVPTITLEELSEAQKRALRLADNKIALGAGWDVDLLQLELAEL